MNPATCRLTGNIVIAGALALGAAFYLSGSPAWIVTLALVVVPCIAWVASRLTGTDLLRRYRFLLYVVVLALLCGGFEAWQHRKIPKSLLKPLDIAVGPGEPDLFLDYDLPGVLTGIYPERSEALFMRGFQLKMCYEDRVQNRTTPAVCRPFQTVDLPQIREYFERAIAQHPKTDENLYYYYVEVLMRSRATQSEIDAATQQWQHLFPRSPRPDPRKEFQ